MRLDFSLIPRPRLSPQKVESVTSHNSPWLTPLAYCLGNHGLLPFYFDQIQVSGQANLPRSGSVILAPTHRSRWDGILVPFIAGRTVTGRDLRFMVTEDEMQGLQGWLIRQLGGFPINTDHPAIASLRHGIDLLLQGHSLVIFPEGGDLVANRTAGVNHLHSGLARIALQAESQRCHLQVKIVPIHIQYQPAQPQWGCQVQVQIGEPLLVSNYLAQGLKTGAKCLTADLEQALKSLQPKFVLEQTAYDSGHSCPEPILFAPEP